MTTINAFSAVNETLDPSKHVNYLLGMVLGVKDFTQEFTYLSNRDQWLARDALGYGTLCGLRVLFDEEKKELTVEPGVALSPSGKLIQVDVSQCAKLDTWFAQKEIQDAVKAANGDIKKLYLSLCYRSCLADPVQIAGEPCRTDTGDDSSLLKPSRIQDDFQLNLSLDPVKLPDQTEENALRDFVAWLRQIKLGASGSSPEEFAEAIRAAALQPETYPVTDFMEAAPSDVLMIPSAEMDEYLRLAFRIWTVELRGQWRGKNADCVHPSQENCVLLAELAVALDGDAASGWTIDSVAIHEERRPYLLHLRMLQEWMLTKTSFPGNTVESEQGWGQLPAAGESQLYSRADHTHGTPPDPIPPHTADPQAHTIDGEVTGFISKTRVAKILNLPVAEPPSRPKAGQVLTLTEIQSTRRVSRNQEALQWQAMDLPEVVHPPVELNGDVINLASANKIDKLQGKKVSAGEVNEDGLVLTFVRENEDDEGAWKPRPIPTRSTDGRFVSRALEAGYEIVAAGICSFIVSQELATIESSYNGLEVESFKSLGTSALIFLKFNGDQPNDTSKYIVKLTPWLEKEDLTPFTTYFFGPAITDFKFAVGISALGQINPDTFPKVQGKIMIEISRFETGNSRPPIDGPGPRN